MLRKLFLLATLAFVVFFGAYLWKFSIADVASFRAVENYYPLLLLVFVFLVGLIHTRTALGLALLLVLLLGNPTLLNELLTKMLHLPERVAVFGQMPCPIESVLLGLGAAWILKRFWGNPELDFEYTRSHTARALHFPVFLLGFAAVMGALYAIIQNGNVFLGAFTTQAGAAFSVRPYAFFNESGVLGPLRSVVLLLEGMIVYVIVTNEVRTARQVRAFMCVLLTGAVVVSLLGLAQWYYDLAWGSGIWKYNKEAHATFADPNTYAVFLTAMLPVCAAMVLRGGAGSVAGVIAAVVLIAAIVLSGTKASLLLVVVAVAVGVLVLAVKAIRARSVVALVALAVALALVIGGVISVAMLAKKAENKRAQVIVKRVTDTTRLVFQSKWRMEDIAERTNFKASDWVTAVAMLKGHGGKALITGIGYGKFKDVYGTYRPVYTLHATREGASNMLLQTWVDTGVFGLLALVLIVVIALVMGWEAAKQLEYPGCARAAVYVLLLLVVGCMTENAFKQPQLQVVFWALAGMCMVNASLLAREDAPRGSVGFNAFILLLALAAWGWVLTPMLTAQYSEKRAILGLVAAAARDNNLVEARVREAFESTRDYGFNRKFGTRWSGKNALVMTKVTGPLFVCDLTCVHPDVSSSNPVNATIAIDGIVVTNIALTSKFVQEVCIDVHEYEKLAAYPDEQRYAVVRISVDRGWIPAEAFPDQFKEDTFTVGLGVGDVRWGQSKPKQANAPVLAPPAVAPATPPAAPAAAPPAPAAAVPNALPAAVVNVATQAPNAVPPVPGAPK